MPHNITAAWAFDREFVERVCPMAPMAPRWRPTGLQMPSPLGLRIATLSLHAVLVLKQFHSGVIMTTLSVQAALVKKQHMKHLGSRMATLSLHAAST